MPSGEHERTGVLIDGRYRLGEVLRQSDRDIVYQAEHTGIQRFVEVKTLPPQISPTGVEAARLIREARAAGIVAHRNVQSVLDSGMDPENRPFIVYEALEGKTVAEILREHPHGVPTERAAPIVLQLLEGLSAVHAGGVIHRLLGPASVTVIPVRDSGELVKLTRFEEAWLVDDAASAEPPLSKTSSAYVAPEGSNHPPVPRYDVYAAGVLLRALLTGQAEPGRPMSDTARRAIDRATAVRAEERFPDARLLLEAVSLLVVSPEGPPREQIGALEDPLEADLQYLQLRRQTSHGEKKSRGRGRVPLLIALVIIEGVYKRVGAEGWPQIVEEIPEVDALLPGTGNTETNIKLGVEVELIANLLATVDEKTARGDLGWVAGLGAKVASRAVARVAPSLEQPLTPDRLVDEFGDLWRRLTWQGDARVLERSPNSARVAVDDQVEPRLEFDAFVAGVLRGCLREGGADADVQITACEALGDAATVFTLTW